MPGSSHPSAILFDSSEHFAKKSAKADEGIRAIKKDLTQAIDTCIVAAGYEWDVGWQRRLLRVSCFSPILCASEQIDSTLCINPFLLGCFFWKGISRQLRSYRIDRHVTNASSPQRCTEIRGRHTYHVRRVSLGSKPSELSILKLFSVHGHVRYTILGPTQLLSRLTGRNHHLLCLQMSSFLQIRPDAILKHWARAKIARSRPAVGALAQGATGNSGAKADDEICDAIVKKFEMQPAVSYADIAKTAWNAGRIHLATKVSKYFLQRDYRHF